MVTTLLARFWPVVWVVLFVLGWADPAPLITTPALAGVVMDIVFAAATIAAAALVIAPHPPAVRYGATVAGMAACATRAAVFAYTPNDTGATPWLVVVTWSVLGVSWVVLIALSWWVSEHERRLA